MPLWPGGGSSHRPGEQAAFGRLTQRLTEEPAIVLNGPRTVGKSTLLDRLARDAGRTVIDLDDPAAFVLYTGRHAYTHEDGTCVVPLDVLWAGERFGKR